MAKDRRVSEAQYQVIRASVNVLLRALSEIADGAEHPEEVAREALQSAAVVVEEA